MTQTKRIALLTPTTRTAALVQALGNVDPTTLFIEDEHGRRPLTQRPRDPWPSISYKERETPRRRKGS